MLTWFRFRLYINESPSFQKTFRIHLQTRIPCLSKPFLVFFCLIIFLNASTASFAYKAFIGCTRRYRDKTSTATSKYLTPLLCWAILSIYATSTDQISFILYATAFSLGKVFLNCLYFVYGAFD